MLGLMLATHAVFIITGLAIAVQLVLGVAPAAILLRSCILVVVLELVLALATAVVRARANKPHAR